MDVCELWARASDQGSEKMTAEAFIRSDGKGKERRFRQMHYIIHCMCKYFSLPGGGGRKEKGESGDQKALTLSSPIWALVVKSN